MKINVFMILLGLSLCLLSCHQEKVKTEYIELDKEFNSENLIHYIVKELEIHFNKDDVYNQLKFNISDSYLNSDSILLNYLSSSKNTIVIKYDGYNKKLDTIPLIDNLDKDTIVIAPDFSDIRNHYSKSMNLIAIELLEQGKAIIIDKRTNKTIPRIKFKQYFWGIGSYRSEFLLLNDSLIMTGDMIWGL